MTGLIRAWILALALGFGLSGAAPALAAPHFPALTGRVVDDAHVLPAAVQADLTAKLAALQQTNGDQLVVVTVPSLQNYAIEDYGYQLGRAWGLGQKGNNNGALFIIAPTEHKMRIEVGYGLEPVLTDAMSNMIQEQVVLPKFKAGDIPGGVVAGTEALVQQLGLDPAKAQANAQAVEDQPRAIPISGRARGIPVVLILFGVFLVLSLLRGGGGGLWALPFLFMGGGGFGGGRGDDEGGGDSFGGGGGSFGGGGSSGSW